MAMKNPPHPGRSIKRNCLDPLGLSVTEAAKVLGVARHTLSRVLNGRAAVSPAMAIRLEKAGWSNAEFWLRRQTAYDLAQARKNEHRIKIKPLPATRHSPGGIVHVAGARVAAIVRIFVRQRRRILTCCYKLIDTVRTTPFYRARAKAPAANSFAGQEGGQESPLQFPSNAGIRSARIGTRTANGSRMGLSPRS